MRTLSRKRILGRLRYDPETGHFHRIRKGRSVTEGSAAGTMRSDGYVLIGINHRNYYAHRLAWFLCHGEWAEEVDHINNDPSDNRIENLRASTRAKNMWNVKTTQGAVPFRGVCFDKVKKKYVAQISINGRQTFIGRYVSPEAAAHAFDKVALRLRGELAITNFPKESAND